MRKHIQSNFANQIYIYILKIATSFCFARMLLPAQRGEVTIGMTIAILLSGLATLGVPSAIVYNINRHKNDPETLKDSVAVSLRFLYGMPFVLALAYLFLEAVAHNQVFKGLSPALIFSSYIQCIIGLAHGFVTNALMGLMNFPGRNNALLLPYFLQVLVLVPLWLLHRSLNTLQVMYLYNIATLMAVGYALVVLKRKHGVVYHWKLPENWVSQYVHYGLKSCLSNLAQQLNYRLDALIVNALLSNAATGLYSNAVSMAELVLFIPSSIAAVLQPKIAGATEKEKATLPGLMMGTAFSLSAVGLLGSLIVMPWFIPWFYGKPYAGAVAPALWLLPGMMGLAVTKVLTALMSGLGKPQVSAYATLSGLCATIILDYALIPKFGIVGAAWASSIAYWWSALTVLLLYRVHTKDSISSLLVASVREPHRWVQGKLAARNI